MIRVLLVDDHPVVRAGYARFLELDGNISVVAEATCAITGYIAFLQYLPDVTISDISMPNVGGLELLRKIKQRDTASKVLMCSMYDSPSLVRSNRLSSVVSPIKARESSVKSNNHPPK